MSAPGEASFRQKRATFPALPSVHRKDVRLVLPREHGSWALVLLPLISGLIVGYFSGTGGVLAPALWFFCVAMAAFLAYQPLQILLGVSVLKTRSAREQRVAVAWVAALTLLAAIGVIKLLESDRMLIWVFGLVALACFGAAALMGNSRRFRVPRQITGALGLTSTGAAACYVATGRIDRMALLLWFAFWLFAACQIEYVQLRMHTVAIKSRAGKAQASWRVALLHLAALAASIAAIFVLGMPLVFALIFVPAVVRLFFWMAGPARPLKLYVLGLSELVQSIAFSAILTASFLMKR